MRWASLSEIQGAWGRQEVVLHSSCFDLICLILLTVGTRGEPPPLLLPVLLSWALQKQKSLPKTIF